MTRATTSASAAAQRADLERRIRACRNPECVNGFVTRDDGSGRAGQA